MARKKGKSGDKTDDRMFNLNRVLDVAEEEIRRLQSALFLAQMSFERMKKFSGKEPPPSPPDNYETSLKWAEIAAHAAINSLFQYREALKLLCKWTGPTDPKNVSALRSSARKALTSFDQKFPKAQQLRHAIAHSAEVASDFSKNAHRAPFTTRLFQKPKGQAATITNVFWDYTFVTTRKGELLEFDLTGPHVAEVDKIHRDFLKGLSP